jgi:type IV secretion system protein VirB4
MMNLAEYRNKNARLADFLPWVALVGQHRAQQGRQFPAHGGFAVPISIAPCPPNWSPSPDAQQRLPRFGSGWAIFVEAQRHAAATYPNSTFPDRPPRWSMPSARPTSRKRAHFESAIS